MGLFWSILKTTIVTALGSQIGQLFSSWVMGIIRRKLGINTGGVSTTVDLPTGYVNPDEPAVDLAGVWESRDTKLLHPALLRRFTGLRHEFETLTGHELKVTCTARSVGKQAELYLVGRRGVDGERPVTNCDGAANLSKHNLTAARPTSRAVDVAVDLVPGPAEQITWDPVYYDILGTLAQQYGLVWGGNFKAKDRPHLELPDGLEVS